MGPESVPGPLWIRDRFIHESLKILHEFPEIHESLEFLEIHGEALKIHESLEI